jgi:hypothetical protein
MKLKLASVISGVLTSLTTFAAESARLDEATLKTRNETLSRSIYDNHDEETRKRNFATAYPLALKVWADDTLPARIRLAVTGTAGTACAHAMRNHSSPTGFTYRDCPEATNAVELIELLTKALATIPQGPPGTMNVMPPISWNGGGAAGMDPAGIPDPVARAAYEKAIAENKLRIDESNARQRVRHAIRELEMAVWLVMREIKFRQKSSPLPEVIRASSLPEENKKRFLEARLENPP